MINLFPNAWHVARREYMTRVRTRTFAIVTAVLAIVGLGLALAPVLIRAVEGNDQTRIGLNASPGTVQVATLRSILNANSQSGAAGWDVVVVDDGSAAREQVRAGDLDGLLTVMRAPDGDLSFSEFTDAAPTDQRLLAVRTAATQLTVADRLDRAGVEPGKAGEIFAPTRFETQAVDPNTTGLMEGASGVLAYALVILTFMAVITYGTWVANSVAEEKSSRVMELLITAATPRQLMAGKVLGAGAAGLTQYAVVLGAGLLGLALQSTLARRLLNEQGTNLLQGVDFSVLIPFTAFFVPGFLLYCILYAGLGSMASRQEDVNQVTGPMLFVGMGGYFASFVAMATPAAAWVKVLSLIPFFSPYLLTARTVLARNVQPWEWIIAALLMILFLAGALWLAARIYSAGVLMYGQRSNLRSIWRAVRVNR